eukprot:10384267-Karenia_brevis.AAC.1
MHLRDVCPTDVQAMLKLDVMAATWQQWTQQQGYVQLAPRPYIEPIQQQLAKRQDQNWTRRHANAA